MNPTRQEALFALALDKPVAERAAFLDRECAGDLALCRRVEALLAAHEQAKGFLPPGPEREQVSTVIVETPLAEEAGLLIGRYKLLEKLGEGGFGAVWLAEQKEPVRRKIALKIIKLGMDTKQVVARFEAERQALALMDHPNIAKVLDAGTTDNGRPYFVMELVRGIPITRFCDENKLATKDRLDLFIKVCHAIQHAHQKGIIHRDIKPTNILVTLHDGVPVPKVIDFGIAKATQGELTDKTIHTQFQQFIGTPAYMSPEQAEMSGLDIDTRSDIYSLGVLLYELLTGKTPFDGNELLMSGLDEMRRTIREKEPVRPSTRLESLVGEERTTTAKRRGADPAKLANLLRGDLDWIVMKALEKDRTRRYETANGLAADLKRYLTNEPVIARPPSATYRLQKAFRRNKLVFAASGAVAVTLLIGTFVSTWQWIRARQSEHRAQSQAERADAEAVGARKAEKIALEESELAKSQEQRVDAERLRAEQEQRRAEASELVAQQNLYAAHMAQAFQALDKGNIGRTRELVRKYVPEPGQKDFRGWEWRYLWWKSRGDELFTLGSHSNCVTVAAFFPDGRTVASASVDKTVGLWDIESRRLIATLPHPAAVGGLAISPDGLLATGCEDGTVTLWDAAARSNGNAFRFTTVPFVTTMIFSSDGKILAWADSKRAVIWDVGGKRELAAFPGIFFSDGEEWKAGIALSSDKRYFAFGRSNGEIEVWDWETHFRKLLLARRDGPVLTLAFSADGKSLVSGGVDKGATVWNMETGREVAHLTNFQAWVGAVSFSPDGGTLATASADQTLRLWSTESWQEISTLRGHEFEVWWAAFSRDGRKLVTASKDDTIKVWDASAKAKRDFEHPLPADLSRLEFSPDGKTILLVHTNQSFSLFDAATRSETQRRSLPALTNLAGVAISADRKFLAVARKDGSMKLFDPVTGRELAGFSAFTTPAWHLKFSPDSKALAAPPLGSVTDPGRKIVLWDITEMRLMRELVPRSARIWCFQFTPDSRKLAVGYHDGTVELWELSDGSKITMFTGHEDYVSDVAFSNDAQMLATTSFDRQGIQLWDFRTGKELAKLRGQFVSFGSLTFSPDNRRLAGFDADGSVTLWDIANPQRPEVGKLSGNLEGFGKFLPDGDTIIARDGERLRIWRAPSWEEITAAEAREKAEAKQR